MDLNRVALFVRVVEAGSFTAAAAALALPKSSVSRGISQLEEELGVRLLQRTTRKLALTDAGQGYYESVRGAVTGLDEAAAAVREAGSEPRGLVRVSAPPDNGESGLAEALTLFSRRYPHIRIEVVVTGRHVDLVAEGIDLAVRAGPLESSSLVARRIGTTPMALFAAPSYLRRRGKPRVLADLARHDCVLFRAAGDHQVWKLQGPDGPTSVEVTGPLRFDDLLFCRAAALAGGGITLLPVVVALRPAHEGQLDVVLPSYQWPGAHISVVMPSTRYLPTRVALLRDFLVDHLGRKLEEATATCPKKEHHARAAAR